MGGASLLTFSSGVHPGCSFSGIYITSSLSVNRDRATVLELEDQRRRAPLALDFDNGPLSATILEPNADRLPPSKCERLRGAARPWSCAAPHDVVLNVLLSTLIQVRDRLHASTMLYLPVLRLYFLWSASTEHKWKPSDVTILILRIIDPFLKI